MNKLGQHLTRLRLQAEIRGHDARVSASGVSQAFTEEPGERA